MAAIKSEGIASQLKRNKNNTKVNITQCFCPTVPALPLSYPPILPLSLRAAAR